jgi:hypothetical protein
MVTLDERVQQEHGPRQKKNWTSPGRLANQNASVTNRVDCDLL